jgi:hypothetical protein
VAETIISDPTTTEDQTEATKTTEAEVATKASRPAAHITNNSAVEVTLEVAVAMVIAAADKVDSPKSQLLPSLAQDQDKLVNWFQITLNSQSRTKAWFTSTRSTGVP